jgi:hypothetical protein
MGKIILVMMALLLSPNVNAEWVDKQGKVLPNTDDRKSSGSFGAQLIFTDNDQALIKKWAIPSVTVDIDAVETIQINKPINLFVIFSGCMANKSGNCNVSMRFRVIQPDGKVYFEAPAMEVWHDKPAPPDHTLELSVGYLKITIEPHEQRGHYTVQTQVRDDNSGTVIFLQKSFEAIDGKTSKT